MFKATVVDALPLIRMAAKRLRPRLCSAHYNEEDLQQDLALEVHQRIPLFDAGRASLARFVWIISQHHVANIRQRERAQRRDCRRNAWSLNEPLVSGKKGAERGMLLPVDEYEMALGRRSRPEAEIVEMRHDVNRALASASPLLRLAAVTVMFDGIDFAVSVTGTSRATVNRRMKAVRVIFERAGLHHYVMPAASGTAETGDKAQGRGHE